MRERAMSKLTENVKPYCKRLFCLIISSIRSDPVGKNVCKRRGREGGVEKMYRKRETI